MTQKILAGRSEDQNLSGELIQVKADQVVLAREPNRALSEAQELGLKRTAVEIALAYDAACLTTSTPLRPNDPFAPVNRDVLSNGVLIARPGIGFPAAVHLERFGSPARLAVTDEPRMASVGGIGMLALVVPPAQLAEALITGSVKVRTPRSVQVLLSGRVRPFVCVRDVALELIRRGLGEVVERIDREHGAPVVLEFAGPSARLLSVAERAVLCALAPQLGAAAAVFVSDEKTEVYLRDQRRSKAHRGLVPDPGAPCDDAITVDLSAVDPLLMDEDGAVRPVRELAGKNVVQVVLGGDSGASLRDLLAAAALLKSKRVPPRLDLLIAPPSRQALEVLAQSGALVDLIATGARLVEPDMRVVTGEFYPPPGGGLSLRTYDPEPGISPDQRFVVGSAETLAYAVATGQLGDPRSFKRPVRVTVPRALPTDDVLVLRKGKTKSKPESESSKPGSVDAPVPQTWNSGVTLAVVKNRTFPTSPAALVLTSLDDVRWAARHVQELSPFVRAVVAPHIPAGIVPVFAGSGIVALTGESDALAQVAALDSFALPAPEKWGDNGIAASAGSKEIPLVWRALGAERDWTRAGTARSPAPSGAKVRG